MLIRRLPVAFFAIFLTIGESACGDDPPELVSTEGLALAGADSVVMGPGGEVIRVRAGSVTEDTVITVAAIPTRRPPRGAAVVATPVRLAPSGTEFAHAVEIEMTIDVAALPPGRTIDDVVVYRASNGGTAYVPVPTRRTSPASIATITEHFSDFVPVVLDPGAADACGDDVCGAGEDCTSCPFDCGLCLPEGECGNGPCDLGCGYLCATSITVIDEAHGLEWERTPSAVGMGNGPGTTYCAGLDLGGYPVGSWRLPTYAEVATLLYERHTRPAINDAIFEITLGVNEHVVTSTPNLAAGFWASELGNNGTMMTSGVGPRVICVHRNTPATGGLVDNLDGTVSDQRSGLLWQQVADPGMRNTIDQSNFCAALVLGGLPAGSWRAPRFWELASIVDTTRTNPTWDPMAFPGAPTTGNFATSTITTGGTFFGLWSNTGDIQGGFGFTSQTLVRCVH